MKDLLPALLLLHAPLLHAEIAILNEEYSYQGSDLVQVFENQKNQLFVNVGSNWEDYSISITGNVVAIDGNSIYTFSQVGDMSNISSATNVITSPINWTGITRDPSNGTVLALDPTGSRVLRFPLLSDLSDSNNATETHILDDAIPWRGFEIAADGKVYALNSRNSMLCIFASLNDWVNGQDPVDSITVGKEWKGIGKADAQPLPSSLDTSLSAFSSLPRNLASSSAYEIVGAYPSLTFTDPSAMVAHPSGDGFLVSERIGRIYHIDQDEFSSRKDLVLDIRPNVAISHDSGLYNFCFHPDYLNNGYIYVYYTWLPAGLSIPTDFNAQQEADYFGVFLRLSRFTVDPQTGTVDHSTELPMFHVRLYNGSHRGSGLVFGDDGMLYLAIGEQFRKFKAQDIRNTFDGGVLRIDVDMQGGTVSHPPIRKMGIDAGEPDEFSGVGYYIPSDNPFLAADGSIFEEFATLGNRNPYRMSKDRDTGEIFIAEVGDRNREEATLPSCQIAHRSLGSAALKQIAPTYV
ncbi:MAG: PQQ-dependent sugar dehydrogenase [Verrucomicrobiota bacterium]